MSIPKVIHFCWFGGKEYPEEVLLCMKSWEKYCPDFEIKRWDESNFNVNQIPYIQEAYERQKWAFVSDYARLKIIYENGGVYLDTDVELLKPLAEEIGWKGFFGFESGRIATGLGFGAEAGNKFVKAMLENYADIHFVNKRGKENHTPCPANDSAALVSMGVAMNGQYQIYDDVHFLPEEYLNPKNWKTGDINITDKTISIHHYDASWYTDFESKVREVKSKYPPLVASLLFWVMYGKRLIKKILKITE